MSDLRSLDGREIVWQPQSRQLIALRCPADEVMYGGAKGGGKATALSVKVPTPSGWTLAGDLRPGDYVIGDDGLPTLVLAISEVISNEDAYRLSFSDGTSLVAGENHLWKTRTAAERVAYVRRDPDWRARRREGRKPRGKGKRPDLALANASRSHVYLAQPEPGLRTTKEIHDSLYVKMGVTVANHSIDNHAPLQLPEADLPVPPYTLGAWLGDGCSRNAQIAGIDEGVFQQVEADGFAVTRYRNQYVRGILGLRGKLRMAGVLANKFIPSVYLRSSYEQRLSLLCGLMDTDGWCEEDGACKISLTRKVLFDGVVELVRTFGVIVNVTHGFKTATNGSEGNSSEVWTASFITDLPVFRLKRKRCRQKRPHPRYSRRFIVASENLGPQPLRCIKVANRDGMYLAGEQFIPTHNSDYLLMAPYEQIALADRKWRATGRRQRGRAILFRKNLRHLDDLIARSHEIFPSLDPQMEKTRDCGWFKPEKRWVFSSGYKFEFAHLDGPEDHRAYHGQEITALLFDQVEEISREVYEFLSMNVRTKDDDMRKLLMVRCTSNPGGRYAQWVRDYFVAPCRAGNKIIEEKQQLSRGRTKVTTRAFIPAKLADNKYLDADPDYEARIRKLPLHTQRMYLEGDWDVVIGAHFAHVWDERLHVVDPFDVPASWQLKFGMDWGAVAPACLLMGAKDNDGNIYIIDELYGPGATGRQFADRYKKLFEKQRWSQAHRWAPEDVYGLLDYGAWRNDGQDGPGAAQSMIQRGMRLFKANKNRKAGNEQVLERLSRNTSGKPSIYFFRDRCPNIIRTLPLLMSDPKDKDDVDTDGEDHAYDALKYLLMDWPVREESKEQKEDEDVARWLRIAQGTDSEREESITGYA